MLLISSPVSPRTKGPFMQDFRVKTFLAVCQTMNYTTAAKELHITQPAVSQHIAFLEREYGVKLFRYTKRKLALTQEGLILRDALSTMVHDDGLLKRKLQAMAKGQRQDLKIGMTLTAGEYVAARPLALFLATHPEVRATVRSGDTASLLQLLDAGTIDCAFVEGLFDQSPYAHDSFSTEELLCVCSADHPLSGERASLEELLGIPLFVREAGSGTRAVLEHALAGRDLTLSSFADISEVGSLDIIKVLVAEGLGISFMYGAAIKREVEEGALGTIALKGKPIVHDISFLRLKDSAFEPQFKHLFKEMHQNR